jgi:hypothetical protein
VAQIHAGDGRGGGVGVEGGDPYAERRQRHRVRPDAAAEVPHVRNAGGPEAPGMPGREFEPGGLLQAVRGEEHPRREVAELVGRSGAQPGLGQRGGDEAGVVPRVAQRRAEGQGGRLVVRREGLQQRPPLRGQQLLQGPDLHGVHPAVRRPAIAAPGPAMAPVSGAAIGWHSS